VKNVKFVFFSIFVCAVHLRGVHAPEFFHILLLCSLVFYLVCLGVGLWHGRMRAGSLGALL
jgi:hypothetical protein